MSMILSVILWFLIGTATAYFARQRGRDPFVWFILGMLFGVFALLLLFIMPSSEGADKEPEAGEKTVFSSHEEGQEKEGVDLTKEWFYLDKSRQQQGPISFGALKTLWEETNLDASSLVWCEGMGNWKKIAEVADLHSALQSQDGF